MIGKLIGLLDGKKTYLFSVAWVAYKMGIVQGFWHDNPNLEALLLGGGAVSLREAVTKSK